MKDIRSYFQPSSGDIDMANLSNSGQSVLSICCQFCRSAEDTRAALLAAAKPEGIYGDQASDADSLRAKIQQAIRQLQEGLLERATEVLYLHQQTSFS